MSNAIEIEPSQSTTLPLTIWDKLGNWSEWASDFGNAILVKEARQALKSKQFVITFMLMLVACWSISFFGVWVGDDQIQYGETANFFFLFYYGVLTTAVLVIVPFTAFRSLIQERDQFTYDLLSITALKPRQIILGKLASALLQTLIYFSAIAPFIAFTAFLGGFDFPMTLFSLLLAFLLSTFYCTVALMIAAFAKHRIVQSLMTIAVLLGLGILQLFFIIISLNSLSAFSSLILTEEGFWIVTSCLFLATISFIVLFLQIATTQVTFASGNRSTAIRITCFVQVFLIMGSFIAGWFYEMSSSGTVTIDDNLIIVMTILTSLLIMIVGLFTTTESNFLSRRIRRDLPKSGFVRLLSIPFMPGSSRGLIYSLLQVATLGLLVSALWLLFGRSSHSWGDKTSQFILLMCSYLTIFFCFCALLARWGEKLSGDMRPGHVRALALIVLAGFSVIPLFVRFFFGVILNENISDFIIIDAVCPFWTLACASNNYGSGNAMVVVIFLIPCIAMLGILINLPAMITGMKEILSSNFKSTSKDGSVI